MENNSSKILIVDDDVSMRTLIARRLEVEGYEILTAGDGEEGIETIRKELPDLVIMDLMMPKINGYEACGMLRFDERFAKLPIIVLSALNSEAERDQATHAGANAVLIKPFDLNLLKVKIEELLR